MPRLVRIIRKNSVDCTRIFFENRAVINQAFPDKNKWAKRVAAYIVLLQ